MATVTPIEWHKQVVEHYGSIAEFHDRTTVEIIRENIAKKRADNKIILDTEISHPGVVSETMLNDIKAEEAELTDLDAELAQWQETRKAATA